MQYDVTAALWGLLEPVNFTIVVAEEETESGYVVPGAILSFTVDAAILPLTAEDLRLYEPGSYTTQDLQVYTVSQPLRMQSRFSHAGSTFEVALVENYVAQGGYCRHIAKRVQSS